MKKTIQIGKHPYAFNIEVTFGSFEEMLANASRKVYWDGYQIDLGGSFNKQMDYECGGRASFLNIGVQLELKDDRLPITLENVTAAYAISQCRWEGVYWKCTYFDKEIKQGIYPIKADWNGVTYIERGNFDKNHNWVTHYEKTDTFCY